MPTSQAPVGNAGMELACGEEVLLSDDLPKVRLWVGNSLRGLIPARLWRG